MHKFIVLVYTVLCYNTQNSVAVRAHGTHLLAKSKSDWFGKFHCHQYAGAGEVGIDLKHRLEQGCPDRGSRAKFGSLNKFSWLFNGTRKLHRIWLFGSQIWALYRAHFVFIWALCCTHARTHIREYSRESYKFNTSTVVNF